jgi:hypothetical protein
MSYVIRQALCATALSSILILFASAQAQTQGPGMDKVETLSAVGPRPPVGYRYPVMVAAGIGYRRSLDAGERSALKWLSRLIRENPKARTYMVRWHTVRNGRQIPILTTYTFGATQLTQVQFLPDQSPQSKVWRPVFVQELHAVAKRNGTTANFRLFR